MLHYIYSNEYGPLSSIPYVISDWEETDRFPRCRLSPRSTVSWELYRPQDGPVFHCCFTKYKKTSKNASYIADTFLKDEISYFHVLTTNRGETNISTSESTRKISGVSFLRQRRNPRSLFESKNTTGNLPYFLMLLYSNGKKMGKEEIFTAASGIISTLRPEITAGYRLFMKIGGFR